MTVREVSVVDEEVQGGPMAFWRGRCFEVGCWSKRQEALEMASEGIVPHLENF